MRVRTRAALGLLLLLPPLIIIVAASSSPPPPSPSLRAACRSVGPTCAAALAHVRRTIGAAAERSAQEEEEEQMPGLYVRTGDIDSMWTRDAAAMAQPLLHEDPVRVVDVLVRMSANIIVGGAHANSYRRGISTASPPPTGVDDAPADGGDVCEDRDDDNGEGDGAYYHDSDDAHASLPSQNARRMRDRALGRVGLVATANWEVDSNAHFFLLLADSCDVLNIHPEEAATTKATRSSSSSSQTEASQQTCRTCSDPDHQTYSEGDEEDEEGDEDYDDDPEESRRRRRRAAPTRKLADIVDDEDHEALQRHRLRMLHKHVLPPRDLRVPRVPRARLLHHADLFLLAIHLAIRAYERALGGPHGASAFYKMNSAGAHWWDDTAVFEPAQSEMHIQFSYPTLTFGAYGPPHNSSAPLLWGAFRPSDDPQLFSFHIPSNVLVAQALRRVATTCLGIARAARAPPQDGQSRQIRRLRRAEDLGRRARALSDAVFGGLRQHGIARVAYPRAPELRRGNVFVRAQTEGRRHDDGKEEDGPPPPGYAPSRVWERVVHPEVLRREQEPSSVDMLLSLQAGAMASATATVEEAEATTGSNVDALAAGTGSAFQAPCTGCAQGGSSSLGFIEWDDGVYSEESADWTDDAWDDPVELAWGDGADMIAPDRTAPPPDLAQDAWIVANVLCYEVDAAGACALLDDANSPSLLSLPLDDPDERAFEHELYITTRAFVLSPANPYFYAASETASGVGSAHTSRARADTSGIQAGTPRRRRRIWPLALAIEARTALHSDEASRALEEAARYGPLREESGAFVESFDVDEPADTTRTDFAWASAAFATAVQEVCGMAVCNDDRLKTVSTLRM